MWKPFVAALGNFFFMGLGTLAFGRRKLVGLALTLGAIALTYVELNLQGINTELWGIMFGTVFLMNTALAIDGFREVKAKMLEEGNR